MTKRMLSLLLALVMTLSLCVPALAADDFAAEAVTEVEEQAPEAPEAPVAPEAEEPAEEPVVDEPAAEEAPEAVEDEPEMASILPEDAEDLPLLVKLGVVSKEAHWDLYDAVQKADKIMDDVKAGVYTDKDWDGYATTSAIDWDKYDPDEDPLEGATKDFLEKYDAAKEMLEAVDGKVVNYDVTTSEVQNAATALSNVMPKADGTATNSNQLTKAAGGTNMTDTILKALITNNAAHSYTSDTTASAALSASTIFTASIDVTKNAAWTKAYKTEYLTALKKAIDLVNSYPSTGDTYAQYSAALTAVLDALEMEAKASRPAESDLTALNRAIANAESALAGNYKADNYALKKTSAQIQALIGVANGLKDRGQGLNGFKTSATNYACANAIEDLENALVRKDETLKIESWTLNSDGDLDIIFSVLNVEGDKTSSLTADGTNLDGNQYEVTFKCGDEWYNSGETNKASETTATKVSLNATWTGADQTKYPNKYINTYTLGEFGSKDGTARSEWANKEKITVYLYVSGEDHYFTSQTITVSKEYNGPIIKEAKVSDYPDGSVTAPTYNQKLTNLSSPISLTATNPGDATITVKMSGDMTNYAKNMVIVSGSNKKEIGSSAASAANDVTITPSNDEYLVAGSTVKVALMVNTVNSNSYSGHETDYVEQHSVMLEVKPLSSWKSVAAINAWLDLAEDLVQSDYDKVKNNRNDVESVAKAFQTINADISTIRTYLTGSTYANSKYNQQYVIDTLKGMLEVCGYLQTKTADLTTMNTLLNQAKDKLAEGDDEYTFDSYWALDDIYNSTSKPTDASLQSEVDAYVAKLQAALNGLTKEGEVDKTALNKAIADAKALVEADYTPESWAANKTAIDTALAAAKTVAANEDATQAAVDAAKAALDAALAKLVKVKPDEPEGPKAPASGTGWNYYNNEWYFFKNGKLVSNYWVGKIDGASQWDSNWYYVGADGKMLTGMQYIDDLHGGYGWYFLQPTNTKGEIGKMLTGYQWVGGQYGECYFSKKNGESGKCTWSKLLGNWNGTTWVK